MLTCKDFLREISEFLDEASDPLTRAELEQHMSQCPNCWVIFDTTKKTVQIFRGMEPEPIPSAVQSRLLQALEKRMAARKCSAEGTPASG